MGDVEKDDRTRIEKAGMFQWFWNIWPHKSITTATKLRLFISLVITQTASTTNQQCLRSILRISWSGLHHQWRGDETGRCAILVWQCFWQEKKNGWTCAPTAKRETSSVAREEGQRRCGDNSEGGSERWESAGMRQERSPRTRVRDLHPMFQQEQEKLAYLVLLHLCIFKLLFSLCTLSLKTVCNVFKVHWVALCIKLTV